MVGTLSSSLPSSTPATTGLIQGLGTKSGSRRLAKSLFSIVAATRTVCNVRSAWKRGFFQTITCYKPGYGICSLIYLSARRPQKYGTGRKSRLDLEIVSTIQLTVLINDQTG